MRCASASNAAPFAGKRNYLSSFEKLIYKGDRIGDNLDPNHIESQLHIRGLEKICWGRVFDADPHTGNLKTETRAR